MKHYQAIVIGGGSAGLSAAITLKENGVEDILVIEKDHEPGGILQQCIHNGFGLHTFNEQLSGPEYAERFIVKAREHNIEIKCSTMVTHLTNNREVEYVNKEEGYVTVSGDVIILAVGCYERTRGAIQIEGSRPAGIFTAGQAQRYLNIDGYLVGKKVFILGSGDIGLIMARRMTLEGAKVYGVAEIMPYSNGLPRNIKQCLDDFDIPLYLSHTVSKVFGKDRLERIEVSKVDENRNPIKGTEMYFDVDTLLLSVGLIPENHLASEAGIVLHPRTRGPIVDDNYMTNVEGIFSCGNGLHVHDLVDYVTLEASRAALGAIAWMKKDKETKPITVTPKDNVSYTVPTSLSVGKETELFFRITKQIEKGTLIVRKDGEILKEEKKEKLMPSVMETVKVKIDDENVQEVTLEIVEG